MQVTKSRWAWIAAELTGIGMVYAVGCYNVTAGHRRAVECLTTLEAVLGYDFKAGYPEKVSMEI